MVHGVFRKVIPTARHSKRCQAKVSRTAKTAKQRQRQRRQWQRNEYEEKVMALVEIEQQLIAQGTPYCGVDEAGQALCVAMFSPPP